MTRRVWGSILALAVTSGVFASSPAAQQQTLPIVPALPPPVVSGQEEAPIRPGARMKRFEEGRKIVDRFDARAGDRDVVVERWEDDHAEGPPLGYSPVAWQTIFSPVVMVVKVTSVEGYLTEDETWINSRVTATVTQLLKNATSADLRLNSEVTFVTDGGAIKTGSHVLEAISRSGTKRAEQFRKNRDYLIFTVNRPGNLLYAYPPTSFEIVGKELRPLRGPTGNFYKAFVEAGADAVIAEASASRNLQAPVRKLQPADRGPRDDRDVSRRRRVSWQRRTLCRVAGNATPN